jgi:hypothetical protein
LISFDNSPAFRSHKQAFFDGGFVLLPYLRHEVLGSSQSSYVTGSDLMADGGIGQV